jgi:hypothetical protein
MNAPLRIFIGSGEASLLERKVLIYSLRKHASRPLDIRVFNGTHDSLETDGAEPLPLNMPLAAKYRNVTEFSNYRFLIPQLCGHAGRAAWIDSDTVCLADIAQLFDSQMGPAAILAKPDAYDGAGGSRWGLSVALFDCARCAFDIGTLFDEVAANRYTYTDLHQLSPAFRAVHPIEVAALDANWNVFDRYDAATKLVHYTNLLTQPWKFRGHRYGGLWFRYFDEARRDGFITGEDIELTLVRAYARQDLLAGNDWSLAGLTRWYLGQTRRLIANHLRRRGFSSR